jgi:hypothetical protein
MEKIQSGRTEGKNNDSSISFMDSDSDSRYTSEYYSTEYKQSLQIIQQG